MPNDLSGWQLKITYDNGGTMTTWSGLATLTNRIDGLQDDARITTILVTRVLPNGDLASVKAAESPPAASPPERA